MGRGSSVAEAVHLRKAPQKVHARGWRWGRTSTAGGMQVHMPQGEEGGGDDLESASLGANNMCGSKVRAIAWGVSQGWLMALFTGSTPSIWMN
jgi:hypothetical protein